MPFNTQEEIYKALIAEQTIVARFGAKVKLIGGVQMGHYDGEWRQSDFGFLYPEEWSIYKEPAWYDDITECGILCWVWDYTGNTKRLAFVTESVAVARHMLFTTLPHGTRWKNAIPLTKEEAAKYIYQGAN